MALRNQIAIGRPDVFPSHSGGIPFFIGNNPAANGRWNTAGDLLSGQVGRERFELAAKLGIRASDPAELDRAVGAALRERALRYIREQPRAWLALELNKLWLTLGNHRFVRDYDARGEAELIGAWHAWGLPFGALLGLGVLGLCVLVHRARAVRAERALLLGVVLVLIGQLCAVLGANLLIFTSAQNRLPLCVPLAFAAGPGLVALYARLRRDERSPWQVRPVPILVAALLLLQAFVPRSARSDRPTSVHYYNLAAVEEAIGRLDAAAEHYRRAAQRNPRQPVFQLSHARALRRLGRGREAEAALRRLEALTPLSGEHRAAVAEERRLLAAGDRR
jgi:tetratricopeptide (TPR) repeat protein